MVVLLYSGVMYSLCFCCSLLAENELSVVNRAMFRGLSNLQSLSLYGNLVTCVTPGAFDELSSLTSLNLISNPFNCNCHMAWFADWLRRRGLTNSGPRCVQLTISTLSIIISSGA